MMGNALCTDSAARLMALLAQVVEESIQLAC
jgi:hypothetical protein